MKKMTVADVAKDLNITQQAVREKLKKGIYPFGDGIIYEGSSKWTFHIYADKYKLWKADISSGKRGSYEQ